MDVRIYVKHGEYDKAKKLFGGKLSKYLDDPAQAKALAQALKIAINSVYGLTSATFDNPFRNPKNANNIVALRGGFIYAHSAGRGAAAWFHGGAHQDGLYQDSGCNA